MIGIFLDTETNGLDSQKHVPIEIAIQVIDLEDGTLLEKYESLIHVSKEAFDKSDITSLAFTGITYDELMAGKKKDVIKKEILEIFKKHNLVRKKAVFICQNPSFDRVFFTQLIETDLQEELSFPYNWLDLASMHWACCMRDSIPTHKIQLSKDGIANFFKLGPEEKPHRAANGVAHLVKCYESVSGFSNN